MNILCVVPTYWPAVQFGGPIFALRSLNRALSSCGSDVTVYTTNTGIESCVPANKVVMVDDTRVTYFSCNRLFEAGSSAGWQFSLPLKRAIAQNVATFDLVYIASVWNYPSAVAAHYCRLHHKPYVFSPRGHLYTETMQSKWWKKSPYYHLVMKRHLQRSSAIHYTTADEADKCHNRLKLHNRALVIPNGVDLSEFVIPCRRGAASNKRVILFLGRINWKKGLDILIPAFAALQKTHPDTHLLIAGNDQDRYKKRVQQWIGEHGLNNAVSFSGHLNEEEKRKALAGSELFVLPSYSENFGNAALEAMASGIPVIVSNKVGLAADISASGAGRVIELRADELTSAMAHLLDHSNVARECGERGKRLVREKFTWDKIALQMRAEFEQIVNANSRPALV